MVPWCRGGLGQSSQELWALRVTVDWLQGLLRAEALDPGQEEASLAWQVDRWGTGEGGLFPQLGGSGNGEGREEAQAGFQREQVANPVPRALEW